MKKLLFVSLAAALTLASCSSDDKQNAPVNPGVTEGYIAFNISGVGNNGSRAEGYEDGTGKESEVNNINLYFFDIYGRQTREGAKLPEEATFSKVDPDANGANSIEDQYKTVAILLTKDEANANANGTVEVLAVVNQDGFFAKTMTKADIVAHLSHNKTDKNYAQNDLKGEAAFSMSSSVYRDGEIVYDCTPISLNNVFTTEVEAVAHPVDIYVEREMAKVEVSAFDKDNKVTFDGNDGKVYNNLDATASEDIKVVIKGIGVTYVPTTSNLFKQHDEAWISNPNLVSATNHRSFWADPVYSGKTENYLKVDKYEKYPYNAGNQVVADADGEYLNLSWNGQTALTAEGAHVYVTENTTGAFSHIMLLGQIVDNNGDPVSLVRWAGKNYKADTFKTQYVNMLKYAGYWKQTAPDTYATLDADDLEWYKGEAHQLKVKDGKFKAYENTCYVKTGVTVVKKNAQGGYAASSKAEADEELLKAKYIVWCYETGMNYYYLPIKSGFTAGEAGAAVNGIVRNHVYRVNVKTIKGLGTPVADPAEVIIPENPEDKAFFMAATINVLQWRVVAGDYDFTTK